MKKSEKWQWWHDMTSSISKVETEDEFDDVAHSEEEAKKQGQLLHQIANGFEWMREEERIGRWLGFAIAIFFWLIVVVSYIRTH